jgi:hypothetical protein
VLKADQADVLFAIEWAGYHVLDYVFQDVGKVAAV